MMHAELACRMPFFRPRATKQEVAASLMACPGMRNCQILVPLCRMLNTASPFALLTYIDNEHTHASDM